VTSLLAGRSEFDSLQGQGIFLFATGYIPGAHPDFCPGDTRGKAAWSDTCTPAYVLMARCLVKHRMRRHGVTIEHRDNLTITFKNISLRVQIMKPFLVYFSPVLGYFISARSVCYPWLFVLHYSVFCFYLSLRDKAGITNVCTGWMVGGSGPCRDWEFFSLSPYPDRLWGPPSLLSNGYQGLFPWG
jgi:hypothetical protein